jgi:hypothetical protein
VADSLDEAKAAFRAARDPHRQNRQGEKVEPARIAQGGFFSDRSIEAGAGGCADRKLWAF